MLGIYLRLNLSDEELDAASVIEYLLCRCDRGTVATTELACSKQTGTQIRNVIISQFRGKAQERIVCLVEVHGTITLNI